MRDRVYIVPTWLGLGYFGLAVLFFVWGAFGMHPLMGFLGFYLVIFFVFGALQTNDNLKGLTLEVGAGTARVINSGRHSRFALRVLSKKGSERRVFFIPRLLRPVEITLPEAELVGTRLFLTTSFPIGLFYAWKPALRRPARFAAVSGNGVPGEVIDYRSFGPGDRETDIDWKRSARRGQRVIKVRENEPPPLAAPLRRPTRALTWGLLAQPAVVLWLWHLRLWLAQAALLADLAALWFLFSHFFFPLDQTGRLPAMLASLVRVFVISVVAFAGLALLSPDFLSGLLPNPRQARVGFTRIAWMDPGQVARVRESNELVFRARLDPTPLDVPYWRGVVLQHTNNGLRWFDAIEESIPSAVAPAEHLIRQQILLADIDAGPLALDRPVLLPARGTRYYEAISDPRSFARSAVPEGYRQVPKGVAPELRRLAEDWRRDAPELESFTARAREFFHRDFRYRLDPGTYARDGLTEFLWRRREGFCEHFAGAYATLLRLGGFSSRIVKGFKGGERNPWDGTYRVRAKHAHVWVEAYSEKRSAWERLDPTDWVEDRGGEESPTTLWRRLASLAYDWEMIADYWAFLGGKLTWRVENFPIRQALGWLACLAVFAALLATVWVARSRARNRRPPDPAFAFYDEHCRRMAAQGIARLPNEGPLDYASRCRQKLPAVAASIHAVTQKYLELRYRA